MSLNVGHHPVGLLARDEGHLDKQMRDRLYVTFQDSIFLFVYRILILKRGIKQDIV